MGTRKERFGSTDGAVEKPRRKDARPRIDTGDEMGAIIPEGTSVSEATQAIFTTRMLEDGKIELARKRRWGSVKAAFFVSDDPWLIMIILVV
jgi:hypothetical protein